LVRVGRPNLVVQFGYLVEQTAGCTSVLAWHPAIMP
jgi:hypothetical protein